jgi:hypothetical protein
MKLALFTGAILMLLAGHFSKMLRWKQFIEIYETPKQSTLLQALAAGYLINFFLPFRIGEILRAFLAGRKMENGFSFALSTVIVDRFLDVVVVGVLFLGIVVCGIGGVQAEKAAWFYAVFSLILILLAGAAFRAAKYIKIITKLICSIFNARIQLTLLFFFWSLITSFKDIFFKLSNKRLCVYTFAMWFCYLMSYYLLALFMTDIGTPYRLTDVFLLLFSRGTLDSGTFLSSDGKLVLSSNAVLLTGLYILLPLCFLLVISLVMSRKQQTEEERVNRVNVLNLLPQIKPEDRLSFLETYFSGNGQGYISRYLEINQGIRVLQDFTGGSHATTILCMDEQHTFYRKYAFENDGDKLCDQLMWLKAHKRFLKLPEILKAQYGEGYCYYDMPYYAEAVGAFQYIHSMPMEQTWPILENILKDLHKHLYNGTAYPLDQDKLSAYVDLKVQANLDIIINARELKPLMGYDVLTINGRQYKNLLPLKPYLQKDHLKKVFAEDICFEIHGDLTLENIIFWKKGNETDYYLIDPNAGNIHDSPNLDYGKLMQSLHGGYDFLMRTSMVHVDRNRIDFLFTKSQAYNELWLMFDAFLKKHFSPVQIRSIYYHEVIHWLRLMPYKLEKKGKSAVVFYAGLVVVLNDVVRRFEELSDEEEQAGNF